MNSCTLWCVGLVVLFAFPLAVSAQVPGGWAKADVADKAVVDAAKFAVAAERQALKVGGKEVKLTLDKVLAAEQQVVSGLNYKLTLQVKAGDEVKQAQAVVWARVWLKEEERYKLTAWKFEGEKE